MELHVDTISDIHSNPMGEEINLRDIKNDIIRTPSPLSCKKVQVPNDYTMMNKRLVEPRTGRATATPLFWPHWR